MCPVPYMQGESNRTDWIVDQVTVTSGLKKIPQLYDKVVDTTMEASLYSRNAYILEKGTGNTWINVYIWLGTSWHLQTTYQALTTRVHSRRYIWEYITSTKVLLNRTAIINN